MEGLLLRLRRGGRVGGQALRGGGGGLRPEVEVEEREDPGEGGAEGLEALGVGRGLVGSLIGWLVEGLRIEAACESLIDTSRVEPT